MPPGAVFVETTIDKAKKPVKSDKPQGMSKLDMDSIESQMEKVKITNKLIEEKKKPADEADEQKKKVRKLKKTLRQIRELEESLKSGQIVRLEKEQLDKVERKDAIIAEILGMGEELDEE